MTRVVLWEVSRTRPERLVHTDAGLEKELEDWLEADASLIQGDLEIVSRQMTVEAGRLDLLALDPQGRLCVVEIKSGALSREAVSQAIDYAACLDSMETSVLHARLDQYLEPRGKSIAQLLDKRQAATALEHEQRQLLVFVIGVGREPDIERVSRYLSKFGFPLVLVSFEVFRTQDGRRLLSRVVEESESDSERVRSASSPTTEELRRRATESGIGSAFEVLFQAGEEAGLYPRTFKNCVMFAPPAMKARALFTIWADPRDGRVQAWVGVTAFTEFFPVSEKNVRATLGVEGWRSFDQKGAEGFSVSLKSLFRASKDQ